MSLLNYTNGNHASIVLRMDSVSAAGMDSDVSAKDRLIKLLAAVANGDRAAFESFYDLTVSRAFGLVLHMLRSQALAEDVISEAYLQVWEQAGRFDASRSSPMGWLTMICRSRALDLMRKRRSVGEHEFSVSTLSDPSDLSSVASGGEASLADPVGDLLQITDQCSALHRALQQLGDQQRQLLALAYFRGFSHAELAKFTGLPLGTVKTQVRRSVERLRGLMANDEQ